MQELHLEHETGKESITANADALCPTRNLGINNI